MNGAFSFPVHIAADPRWFDAHFPGQPIVPGVVLLAALEAGCRDACGGLGMLRAVRRLRFLVPVRAPQALQASVRLRGAWLHCALALPAPADASGMPGSMSGSMPASTEATDVLRAQLRFEGDHVAEVSGRA